MTDIELKEQLDSLVMKYNVPEFADNDPVGFPRRFTDKRDIEIASLLVSTIAWGQRPMILRDADHTASTTVPPSTANETSKGAGKK